MEGLILRRRAKKFWRLGQLEAGEEPVSYDSGTETTVGVEPIDVVVTDRALFLLSRRHQRLTRDALRLPVTDVVEAVGHHDGTQLIVQTRQTARMFHGCRTTFISTAPARAWPTPSCGGSKRCGTEP